MAARIYTISASAPFAQTLVRGIIAEHGHDPLKLSAITIYLPTRRATRTLADIFAKELGAALLPEMRPLGDVDEEEFLFDGEAEALDLPPAMDPVHRRLLLARLIQRWHENVRDGALGFAQAAAMAKSLAAFLDEAETQNADLAKLDSLAPERFAGHWQGVVKFLGVARDEWPKVLAAHGAVNWAARRNLALERLRRKLEANPPDRPIIAAGSTGSVPATARLLKTIAHLPKGMIVLPGLDREMDGESWSRLDEDPGHPQFGLKQLLREIGARRDDVATWPVEAPANPAREKLLREALRPSPTTDAWLALKNSGRAEIAAGLQGLTLIEAAHPREEAACIALVLRETLETPGRMAALVTPDRNLARRVAAEMRRWNIPIDDSAGQPLAHSWPGAFLSLLAEAAGADFAPVPFLALLKHPLCAAGMEPAAFRRLARLLDRLCLRGPRPDPGLNGISRAIARAEQDLRNDQMEERAGIGLVKPWFARLAKILEPLAAHYARKTTAPHALLSAHVAAAEALAATDTESGKARLWCGPAGEAAVRLIASLDAAMEKLDPIEPGAYAPLFRALAEEKPVRPPFGQHPRLSILGTLEARLLSFDVVVLGGLNEGTWPRAANTDPWLSRPMRKEIGLEAPERSIGRAAHDFAMLAAGPKVYLSRAQKVDGVPAVASRWLQRLEQLTKGLDLSIERAGQYGHYAALLDKPERPPEAMPPPRPRPPVEERPRKLSVTDIETWLRDPYAIYAKHILRLRPLDPLDADTGPLERGNMVHEALERFLDEFPDVLGADATARLIAIADEVFAEQKIPHSVLALWKPRFRRAARWFVDMERARRTEIARSHTEVRGEYKFRARAGDFILFGYADRIDELRAGGAAIVDYKTGSPPSEKQVTALLAPQLPLEGLILSEGMFSDIGRLAPSQLLYIKFSGGLQPGQIREIKGGVAQLVAEAKARLIARVNDFDRSDKPYDAYVIPVTTRQPNEYEHLERVREWLEGVWDSET